MSTERAELPSEDDERGWKSRLREVSAAGRTLLATRLAIFQEEASAKAILAAKGAAALAVGAVLGVAALLLGPALLAAVLARLTHNVVLGILLAMVLYGAGAAVAVWLGVRWLSRVRPLEYPVASAELSRDFEAIAAVLAPLPAEPLPEEEEIPTAEESAAAREFEDRFRRGSE